MPRTREIASQLTEAKRRKAFAMLVFQFGVWLTVTSNTKYWVSVAITTTAVCSGCILQLPVVGSGCRRVRIRRSGWLSLTVAAIRVRVARKLVLVLHMGYAESWLARGQGWGWGWGWASVWGRSQTLSR